MNEAVIDASVALRWIFEDEEDRAGAIRVRDALVDGRLLVTVPPTFLPEVAGVLVRAVRAGRLHPDKARFALGTLERVAIDDPEPHGFAVTAMAVALDSGLRLQDATYLETARRVSAPLISADHRQVSAARSSGIGAVVLADLPAQEL